MPSGAKKRKAAKKKLQREAHKNGSLSQGNDEPSFRDDGEVEKDSNHEEGGKVVGIIDKSSTEAKVEENLNDVAKEADDGDGDSSEGQKSSGSSGSSSSSSSDDDEVAVEKEKLEGAEVGEVGKESEPPVSGADVFDETDNLVSEESIPTVESIKEVVSYPEGSGLAMDDVPVENSPVSDAAESGLKESDDKVLPQSDQNETVYSVDETKVILVDEVSGSTCENVENVTKEEETLLPQSSGVTTVDRSCVSDDHVKESEKLKVEEQQLLISSAPTPVRRTSWMGCCGLFEVLSGGSSR